MNTLVHLKLLDYILNWFSFTKSMIYFYLFHCLTFTLNRSGMRINWVLQIVRFFIPSDIATAFWVTTVISFGNMIPLITYGAWTSQIILLQRSFGSVFFMVIQVESFILFGVIIICMVHINRNMLVFHFDVNCIQIGSFLIFWKKSKFEKCRLQIDSLSRSNS